MTMNGLAGINEEQKHAALEAVLASQTFQRSDQLRRFLKYVCEMEIAGRAGEINEYLIGVEALGRPEDYSPGDDSAVRNRAYALRRKLEEYYTAEAAGAPVRIDLPKGSYCPRFLEAAGGESPAPEPPAPSRAMPALGLAAAFLAGLVVTAAAAAWLWRAPRQAPASQIPEVLVEAWGPLLRANGNTMVCIATPAHLFLRPYAQQPRYARLPEAPPGLEKWYEQRHTLAPGQRLFMLKTHNSPLWGDAVGSVTATRVLAAARAGFQVLPERVLTYTSLRGRNLIVFGTPEYSDVARRLLAKSALTIEYNPERGEHVIRDQRATEAAPLFVPGRDRAGESVRVYGLITVMPSEGAVENEQRTVSISGLNSAGTQAAAEFFSSPASMEALRRKFRAAGRKSFPPAYQVVVETTSDATLPLTYSYKTHVVLR